MQANFSCLSSYTNPTLSFLALRQSVLRKLPSYDSRGIVRRFSKLTTLSPAASRPTFAVLPTAHSYLVVGFAIQQGNFKLKKKYVHIN
eukprot:scaffold6384_cov176-Ochromonas_danica.AAC.7